MADETSPLAATALVSPPAQAEGSVKDTIESVLVAFILAFIFRAFVVEAFVIPTGSMAPTLYGAHMRFRCPDCGYTYDVNYSSPETRGDEPDIPSSAPRMLDYVCPNCGYPVGRSLSNLDQTPVRFGDRILVLKYLYLFEQPRRWDVVVFKSPYEPQHSRIDPEYSQNYIKRLIGKPNESIVILDGDIYAGPFDAELKTAPQQFQIQRKPAYVQEALWRTVYDNDYLPQGRNRPGEPWQQPWEKVSGDGWQLESNGRPSRAFRFANDSGAGALAFDPDTNPQTHGLTDWLAYDQPEEAIQWSPHYVSDLKLSCFYRRDKGDGSLRLRLTKSSDCFTVEITPGQAVLKRGHIRPGEFSVSDESVVGAPVKISALSGSSPVKLEFSNVDYRVTVRINGADVIQTSDAQYGPDVRQLYADYKSDRTDPLARPLVRVEAERQACTIEHLTLSRDVYYLNRRSYPYFWASPDRIVHLQPDEYFVMGDNSLISGDARYWNDPVDLPGENLHVESGRVPGRFMLGKAFFVYWPAGYRPLGLPVGLAPDFGEMRFIH